MILFDANILINAYNDRSPFHGVAARAIESAVDSGETVGLAWVVVLAFLRVTTQSKPLVKPLSIAESFQIIDELLEAPSVSIVEPGAKHLDAMKRVLLPLGIGGNLTTDAHLAALSIEHRATILSFDHDFARFPGVRWKSPAHL